MLIPLRVMIENLTRSKMRCPNGVDPSTVRVFASATQIKAWQGEMAKAARQPVTSTTPLPTTIGGVPIITVQVDPAYIGWPAYPQV